MYLHGRMTDEAGGVRFAIVTITDPGMDIAWCFLSYHSNRYVSALTGTSRFHVAPPSSARRAIIFPSVFAIELCRDFLSGFIEPHLDQDIAIKDVAEGLESIK